MIAAGTMRPAGRGVAVVAALALLVLPACGRLETGRATAAGATAPGMVTPSAEPASGGANSLATSVPVRADNLRLVRSGTADLALQFEFVNTGTETISPSRLGMEPRTYHVDAFLVDTPRGTGYAVQHNTQANPALDFSMPDQGRVSATVDQSPPTGKPLTVTLTTRHRRPRRRRCWC